MLAKIKKWFERLAESFFDMGPDEVQHPYQKEVDQLEKRLQDTVLNPYSNMPWVQMPKAEAERLLRILERGW